jgi:hypothetical protein
MVAEVLVLVIEILFCGRDLRGTWKSVLRAGVSELRSLI